jgi:hypothetical protein
VIANYRTRAYNRINARLRKVYVIPIVSTDATDIGFLQNIEANLAAGNILLAVATLNEAENLHEYGKSLIDKAEKELDELSEEEIVLSSLAIRDTDDSDEAVDPPAILGGASDEYATFERPMSGIENDALEGKVDSEKYSELEDTKT